jgi:aspartyl-tRNA(Asn)/glutamyl-tRNA(Gln) amidotransferase subunit C
MKITSADVRHVAQLARISLNDEQIAVLGRQLNDIVGYVELLREIDTVNIEPTSHIMPLNNVFREDSIKSSLPRHEMLSNAPDSNERFYIVPKIIE